MKPATDGLHPEEEPMSLMAAPINDSREDGPEVNEKKKAMVRIVASLKPRSA